MPTTPDSDEAGSADESRVDLLSELAIGAGDRAREAEDDSAERSSHASSDIDVRDLLAELGIGKRGRAHEGEGESGNESSDDDAGDIVEERGRGSQNPVRDRESSGESSEGDIGGDLVAELGIGTRGQALGDSDDEAVVEPAPYRKALRKTAEPEFRVQLSPGIRHHPRKPPSEEGAELEDDIATAAALAELPAAFQTVGLPPPRLRTPTPLENFELMRWMMGADSKARHYPLAGLFSIPVNSMVLGPKRMGVAGAAGAARSASEAAAGSGQCLRASADALSKDAEYAHWKTCSARARRAARSLTMLEHLEAMRHDRAQRKVQEMEETETARWDDAQLNLSLGHVAYQDHGFAMGRAGDEVEQEGSRLVLRPGMRRRAPVQAKTLWKVDGKAQFDSSRPGPKEERKRRLPLSRLSVGLLESDLQLHRSSNHGFVTSVSQEVAAAQTLEPVAAPSPVVETSRESAPEKESTPITDKQDVDDLVAGLDLGSDSDDDGNDQKRFSIARGIDIIAITAKLERGDVVTAPAQNIRDRMAERFTRDFSEEELLILAEKEKAAKAAEEQALLAEIRNRREKKELEAIGLCEGEFDKLLEREKLKEAEMLNTVAMVPLEQGDATFPREILQQEVTPEITEHVNKYMEERGAVSEAVEVEQIAADVDAARFVAHRPRQPDPDPNADWDFDFSGDGRPFRFARGKVSRVRAGRGWDDLRIARRQLCGKEYIKFGEQGGVLRHDGVRSPFGGLGECANARCRAHRLLSPHVRPQFRDFLVKWAQSPHPSLERSWANNGLRFASCGNSELLFEAEILERLRGLGIWISQVCLIGQTYQNPSISVRRALREFADWQRASAHLDRKLPAEILVFGDLNDYYEVAAHKGRAAGCHLFIQCVDYQHGVVEACNRLAKRALAPQGMFARLNPQSFLRNSQQQTLPEAESEADAEHSDEAFSAAAWVQEPTGKMDPLYKLRPMQHTLLHNCIAAIQEGNKIEISSLVQAREEALAKQKKDARAKVLAREAEEKSQEAEAMKQSLLQRHKEEIQEVQKRAAGGNVEEEEELEEDVVASEELPPSQPPEATLPAQASMATPSAPVPVAVPSMQVAQAHIQAPAPVVQPTTEQLQMQRSVETWTAEDQKFAQYRVVYKPRVIARAEPKSTGKPVALLYTDEEVIVAPDPHNGWLRIYEGPARAKLPAEAWVCWDATADGLGYMLEQVVRKKSAVPAGA